MVMEEGALVEMGPPAELIDKVGGVFAHMVSSLGPEAAAAVRSKATGKR